ncbi:aspartate kinase [Tindallia californiensis]|uniref:Aspartokinase n=1 Tax=Tindallia californiensis TaxID=159292 RepID=A0A1H3JWE8_9FIRM|nr:aspartate kinase [Tindallia californiensis]SDY44243.1 aspartate kinase [Tindallia californiensis]
MNIKVAKFGGSSLCDASQFQKVKKIIEKDPERKFIVPSAPGKRHREDIKITDLLYLCHAQVSHHVPFNEIFKVISERFLHIAKELSVTVDLHAILQDIQDHIGSGASLDYVASRGEYLNGIILSHYLGCQFLDAAEVIMFHKNGSIDLQETQKRIAPYLDDDQKYVIPGFYGSLPDKSLKIFPRGGSDITGAVVSKSVSASIYENWTDVSGFLVTDPSIIPNCKPIETITYRELRELSYMGAKVLHEETIFPVLEAGIPINVKNTNDPENPGTMIVSYREPINSTGSITGIAGRKDFTVLAIEKNLMKNDISFVRKLLSTLENHQIRFEHTPSGIDSLSLVIKSSELNGKLDKLIEDIHVHCKPDLLEVHPNMALVATVGHGMAYTPGISAKLFTALYESGVNVRMIDQGSSEINIIVGVENKDFEKAVTAIYNAFVK